MMTQVIFEKKAGRLRRLFQRSAARAAAGAAVPDQQAWRSDIVGADVLQVVQLQLQLTYSHVLGGQLLF